MKKFWKKSSAWAGTGNMGDIKTDYKKLVDTFGEFHGNDGYKIDAEWGFEFPDGTFASIYNYKTGKNYLGDEGLELEKITDWHIGGQNKNAIPHIESLLKSIR